ncbi:MAG: hypothetical protein JSU63_17530 [Phycisphaerales bacterium]|nr:MAG: hypothetical protein JSU63_17530 [Phycisphaerales bacterium]
MGLAVTFVSGPRRSGKSAVIRTMIDRIWEHEPHYIRLARTGGGKRPPETNGKPPRNCGVATASWLEYDEQHIFEVLPEALTAIHGRDRFGSVVVEADADPVVRCAYPYDGRIFVMPVPARLTQIFRDPQRAAIELQRVLDDTAAFASEIFGLFSGGGPEDVDPPEERPDLTDSQARAFLYSPLGDELATRIQLQPPYHGLVESDLVIINAGVGRRSRETSECVHRIEHLIERTSGVAGRKTRLLLCDPCDPNARGFKRLIKALEPMCEGGK